MRQLTTTRRSRDYYTTGEMARVLGCAQQTVIRWIDAGRIQGHRLPGPQGERRCLKAIFRQYLLTNGVPLDRLYALDQGLALADAFTTPKNDPQEAERG